MNRTCLKCRKEFQSRGPGHRICKVCKKDNQKLVSVPTYIPGVNRKGGVVA